jgi:hypothetical protein
MKKEVLEKDEVSVLKRLKQRLTEEANMQKDWWLNWGFLVPNSRPDEAELSKGYKMKDKLDCDLDCFKQPKSKYARPVLSSHSVGWSPNIELFGVAQYKRMMIADELKASRKPWRIAKQVT